MTQIEIGYEVQDRLPISGAISKSKLDGLDGQSREVTGGLGSGSIDVEAIGKVPEFAESKIGCELEDCDSRLFMPLAIT